MARKDNMARTKKHVPELTKPVKKPRAYALRYPLPYCESADDSSDATESFDEQRYLESNKLLEELMQSGVDTLETKAGYSSDATESFDEQRYLEANKFREELMQSGVDTLQIKADYSSDATESFDEQRYLITSQLPHPKKDPLWQIITLETIPTSTTWAETSETIEAQAKWKLEDDARLLRNHAETMAWNSTDNVHPNVHPNVQKRRPTSPNNVHPNVQTCRAIRKRKQQMTAIRKRVREHSEAVDAEIQVQARSGVDLYTQMAKKMRLRRRSNEKECVMTGDLADLHKLCITANSNGYPTGCRFCTSK